MFRDSEDSRGSLLAHCVVNTYEELLLAKGFGLGLFLSIMCLSDSIVCVVIHCARGRDHHL